ncbi:MAG: hypothetical protein QM640_12000 [Niabella sp.]
MKNTIILSILILCYACNVVPRSASSREHAGGATLKAKEEENVVSHTGHSSNMNALYSEDTENRSARRGNAWGNKMPSKDRNKVLFYLEQGKTAFDNGNYTASNDYFEQAYNIIDDGIKTSAGQALASNLTNAKATPYQPEDFEKVIMHFYKAINYFQTGAPDEALVEAKRINIKLEDMNARYEDRKNLYKEDAFAHILQGIIYESKSDWNNAFIAYRNAVELFYKNPDKIYFNTIAPVQLQEDLLRMCYKMNFTEELGKYETLFGMKYNPDWDYQQAAIVFWENGTGPVKGEMKLTATNGFFVGNYGAGYDISIPVPAGIPGITSIAIPEYQPSTLTYKSASITVDNTQYHLEPIEDFYAIAKQCLADRMNREMGKVLLRVASKKAVKAGLGTLATHFLGSTAGELTKLAVDITGSILEHADTRNWKSLPATISYTRIPLKQGQNNLTIDKTDFDNGNSSTAISVNAENPLTLISILN